MDVPDIVAFVTVVGLQTVLGLLLFKLLRSVVENDSVALLFSILVTAFPFGAGAVLWASGFGLIPSTVLFVWVLLICRQAGNTPKSQLYALVVTSILSLISLLIQENHFLALAACGTIAWVGIDRKDGFANWCRTALKRFSAWGPLLGCVVYLVLYLLTKQPTSNKEVSVNPESLLSAMFYQFTLIDSFLVWLCPSAVKHLFHSMTVAKLIVALGLAVASVSLIWIRSRRSTRREGGIPSMDIVLVFYAAGLLFLMGAIFAIAGGFSLDSRKKYMMLIPHAILWSALLGPVLIRLQRFLLLRFSRAVPVLQCLFILLGVLTTWLHISLWDYRAEAHQQLLDLLVENELDNSTVIVESPETCLDCPVLSRFWGFSLDEEWVLDLGIRARGGEGWKDIPVEQASAIVSFDPESETWEVEPVQSTH